MKKIFAPFLLLVGFLVLTNSCQQNQVEKNTGNKKVATKVNEAQKREKPKVNNAKNVEQLTTASNIIAKVSVENLGKVNGEKVYKRNCATCHGPKGKMSISGSKKLVDSQLDLTNIIAQVYHGKGAMTPYKNILSEAEILAVSKYILAFQ